MVQGVNLGQLGLLPDQPSQKIPLGGWSSGRNVRFKDAYIRRIAEPDVLLPTVLPGEWLQLYEDTSGPRQVYASQGRLYRRNIAGDAWEDVTNPLVGTHSDGTWQSFQFGTSVVFNNGVEPPQILYSNASNFVDLPNWGLVSVNGTPTQQTWTCRSIRSYGVYMVAMDITINGMRSQNAIISSDPAIVDNVTQDSEMPSWDYASPATRATLNYIGVEHGAIVDGLELNNNFIIYTRESAHIFQLVGGQFVFSNRKILPYGLSSLGAVQSFKNYHFVVGPSSIYVHDGSTERDVADGRISRNFYDNLLSFESVRCVENQEFNEIHVLFSSVTGKQYLIYNYNENTFSYGDATVEGDPVVCMAYGLAPPSDVETFQTVTTSFATETRTFAQMGSDGETREMFWLTANNLHIAESQFTRDSGKEYYVDRFGWDFSEVAPPLTTEKVKSLSTVVPHVQGPAFTQVTVYAAETLKNDANKTESNIFDPDRDYKIDFHIAGRWLGLRVDILGTGSWEMSSMDYDVKAVYGR